MRSVIAVCTIAFTFAAVATADLLPFAVVSFTPGSNSGVENLNSDGTYVGPSGQGTFSPAAVFKQDGTSLALGGASGPPGSIVLQFAQAFFDEAGTDLFVYDAFGASEGFSLDISADGLTFANVGTFNGTTATTTTFFGGPLYTTAVDIASAGISSATYVRITAAPVSAVNYPEAYDLDTVVALHHDGAAVPEPSSYAIILGLAFAGLTFARRRAARRGTAA